MGGTPASRQRHLEFAPEDTPTKADLLADLSRAVADADAVLAQLDLATLETRVEIQGFTVTRFGASTTPWSTLRCTPGRSSGSRSLALVETLASARLRVAWRFPAGSGQAGDP